MKMMDLAAPHQRDFFGMDSLDREATPKPLTFVDNMDRPVHRWFRYSAGFSAQWAESVIGAEKRRTPGLRVLDPFAGSATALIASEAVGAESWGIDAHPFVCRIAEAKLAWRSEPRDYLQKVEQLKNVASHLKPNVDHYPALIVKCFDRQALEQLDLLRRAYEELNDGTPAAKLLWITLLAILRKVSHAGTAQWQYVLPNRRKLKPLNVAGAFEDAWRMIYADVMMGRCVKGPRAVFLRSDARTCEGLPNGCFSLVITSPPYPNNYDYADATRLEMSFLGEVAAWSDLHNAVRRHLVCSCSQHVPERSIELSSVLSDPAIEPIRSEISGVCGDLAKVRLLKGGRKTYHLMVACYFRDLARTWHALRRVCKTPCRICFVLGDSAPYGIYVPVVPWMGRLAEAAGFGSFVFHKVRDRNVKWKNRKHRVPLLEGELWVEG